MNNKDEATINPYKFLSAFKNIFNSYQTYQQQDSQ